MFQQTSFSVNFPLIIIIIHCLTYIHTSYILQDSFWNMGQLIMCNICGQEFETEEELKKHEPFCAFNRKKYYIEQSKKI